MWIYFVFVPNAFALVLRSLSDPSHSNHNHYIDIHGFGDRFLDWYLEGAQAGKNKQLPDFLVPL